ncbi:hypothetical protein [Treponema primitia]|uniref:hypothetical protein n=1 Tax=Treponema primitia TaxID=88058 RepID=UPI0005A13F5E|nr:hypothetical protein [Treponema primitia]
MAIKSWKVLIGTVVFTCSAAFLLPGQEFGSSADLAEPLALEEEQAFNQGPVPEALRLPQRGGESPRYPRDLVIGELGQGTAPDGAWRLARNLLQGVLSGNRESALLGGIDPGMLEELFAGLEPLGSQRYRIGGGREEPDGSTSFLFRFIGRDQSLAGELYLRLNESTWKIEDIIVEEARNISEGGNSYKFDFSPYERFF